MMTARGDANSDGNLFCLYYHGGWVVSSSQPALRQQLSCQGQFTVRRAAASKNTARTREQDKNWAEADADVHKLDKPLAEHQRLLFFPFFK